MTTHSPVVVGLCLLAIGFVSLQSILSDLWKVLLIPAIRIRRRSTIISFTAVMMAIVLVASRMFEKHPEALPFLVVGLTPAITWQVVTWWAWLKDPAPIRDAAFEIATERARRLEEAQPAVDRWFPWGEYVFDVETARRRSNYEPPPI